MSLETSAEKATKTHEPTEKYVGMKSIDFQLMQDVAGAFACMQVLVAVTVVSSASIKTDFNPLAR
jgi:hypothetical protein